MRQRRQRARRRSRRLRTAGPSSRRLLLSTKAQYRSDLAVEVFPAVVAAAGDVLESPRVERCRDSPVENLVAGANEQEITLGPRDPLYFEGFELEEMSGRDLVLDPRVGVALASAVRVEIRRGMN